jgi:hypothetical protein
LIGPMHLLFRSTLVVPYCMNSAIHTPFLFQKAVAISFLAGG